MSEYTQWITKEIRYVCKTFKRRTAGSESVKASMEYMASQLRGWADNVVLERFALHPQAWIGSIALQGTLDVFGVLFYWLGYVLSARVCTVLSIVCFLGAILSWVFEYVLYGPAFDFLYPKKEGVNLFAARKAAGETKQRIILCGHADAAYEISFFQHEMKTWVIYLLILGADLGMAVCFGFGIAALAGAGQSAIRVFGFVEAALLIAYIPWLFFINWRIVVDGANDNLTGCYISMSILKEMAEKGERMEDTDVCVLITDGEESGLRGALAYAEAHREELLETNSIVIALDTIHDPKELAIYHRGVNFTQKNSPEVCALLHEAGLTCGRDLPYAGFYPGGTDAEAFSRYGIKAAGLCAVQHTPSTYYHTRQDSWDNLNEDGITTARDIVKAAVRFFEKQSAEEAFL